MIQEFNMQLRDYLMSVIPEAKLASGGREINCRCRLCGDSHNLQSKHMYIGLGDANTPPMYHCFKCDEGGIVNGRFLRYMQLYDADMISKINSYVNKIVNQPGNQIYKNFDKVYKLRVFNSKCTSSDYKLAYLNNRLGLNLRYEDATSMRIVLNLEELLYINRIKELTRHHNIVNQLSKYFIGFLSLDNAFVILRNVKDIVDPSAQIYEGIDKRYVNYNIFNKLDNHMNYYTVPKDPIDLCKPEPIMVNIAEGAFDAISIAENVVKNRYRNIYMAIRGNAYLNAMKYFIEDLGMLNIQFNIFADNDINDYYLQNIANYLVPFGNPVYLHRNIYEGEKDFGVDISKIHHISSRLI